jgi:hypothetical protein
MKMEKLPKILYSLMITVIVIAVLFGVLALIGILSGIIVYVGFIAVVCLIVYFIVFKVLRKKK